MSQWEEFDAWYAEHGWKYVSSREGAFVVWKAAADTLRQRVQELEKETKQLRDLQYELMRSGALVAIEQCKNATGQRRVIDMYVSANQIAEDLLNAMDSGA